MLPWDKLWTDSYHETRADVYRIAVYPGIDVGVPSRGKQVTPQEVREAGLV